MSKKANRKYRKHKQISDIGNPGHLHILALFLLHV